MLGHAWSYEQYEYTFLCVSIMSFRANHQQLSPSCPQNRDHFAMAKKQQKNISYASHACKEYASDFEVALLYWKELIYLESAIVITTLTAANVANTQQVNDAWSDTAMCQFLAFLISIFDMSVLCIILTAASCNDVHKMRIQLMNFGCSGNILRSCLQTFWCW